MRTSRSARPALGDAAQDDIAVPIAAEQILALVTALNGRDRLTRGHSERVRVLTDVIADELNLLTPDRDRLRWAALLHDIGKLGIDPATLNKPGKPTDDEWKALKGHPLNGASLAAPLAGWLGEWARTIAEHHERFDGSGYPYGLAGSQPDLTGSNVTVHGHHGGSGNNTIASVSDSVDCAGGFHFGSIDLGQLGYFTVDINFTGGTIHWDSPNRLTITFGVPGSGNPTQNNPSVAVYTPDPALGISGTISSGRATQFSQAEPGRSPAHCPGMPENQATLTRG